MCASPSPTIQRPPCPNPRSRPKDASLLELLAITAFALALAGGSALLLLPWETLATAGAYALALGAALGLPAGVWYHVLLHRALHTRGLLPEDWFWRPIELHPLLELGDERRRVLLWCGLGAAGFLVMVLGLVLLGGAAVGVFVRPDAPPW